jgi:ankyrin repeat protein
MVCDYDGDTPLHRAVREGHARIVSLLVEHGATTGHKNLEGLTSPQIADRRKKTDGAQ